MAAIDTRLKNMKKSQLIELTWELASELADDHRHHRMLTGSGYVPCTAHNFIAREVSESLLEHEPDD